MSRLFAPAGILQEGKEVLKSVYSKEERPQKIAPQNIFGFYIFLFVNAAFLCIEYEVDHYTEHESASDRGYCDFAE